MTTGESDPEPVLTAHNVPLRVPELVPPDLALQQRGPRSRSPAHNPHTGDGSVQSLCSILWELHAESHDALTHARFRKGRQKGLDGRTSTAAI